MSKESLLYGVIGLLIGIVVMGATATLSVNNQHAGMMKMMGMHTDSIEPKDSMGHAGMSMNDMSGALKGKTGDDFDQEFITMMIAHHEGAVDMANLAKQQAKHDEIKKMAEDIVTAQTKEISQMRAWQQQWGYASTDMSGHNH